jgi:AhpD family alkylhydroperoxidase
MPTTIHSHRLDLMEHGSRQYGAMARLDASVELDKTLFSLIKVRASQVNGCIFCIDMHWKDARAQGESEERLYSLDAWRESPLYDDRERAALALCESMTLIAETQVEDEVWKRAAAELDPEELTQLVFAIVVINAWNRIAITVRSQPGAYRPRDVG